MLANVILQYPNIHKHKIIQDYLFMKTWIPDCPSHTIKTFFTLEMMAMPIHVYFTFSKLRFVPLQINIHAFPQNIFFFVQGVHVVKTISLLNYWQRVQNSCKIPCRWAGIIFNVNVVLMGWASYLPFCIIMVYC